jgi:hypothetical protein
MTTFQLPVPVSAASLAALLRSRGYRPTGITDSWSDSGGMIYDLLRTTARRLPGTDRATFDHVIGSVRVVIYEDDGPRVDLHVFNRRQALLWNVRFSPNTPEAVVLAAIDAAEVAR